MYVNLDLPGPLEDILRRRAAEAGIDLAALVRMIVTDTVVDELDEEFSPKPPPDFERRLDAWIALHPVLDHAVDDTSSAETT